MLAIVLNVSLVVVGILILLCLFLVTTLGGRDSTPMAVRTEPVTSVSCQPTCLAGECDHVRCAITGAFGQLSRSYRNGQEPDPGQSVKVWTSADGDDTLDGPLSKLLGTVFGAIGLTFAVFALGLVWVVLFGVRIAIAARRLLSPPPVHTHSE